MAQATITHAIIAALNVAVPKQFKRGATTLGGGHHRLASYRSNHDPCAILLALRNTFGIPTPAERQANDTAFAAPWNSYGPIKTFFDHLKDCYVATIIATIQLTGLYSKALIE